MNQIISTHTPLAGRDHHNGTGCQGRRISTHTPLAGRDLTQGSTATTATDFYSHAPRGARQAGPEWIIPDNGFLLTRPSRGATIWNGHGASPNQFLLTRPSRGATTLMYCARRSWTISTHTPLAGRDTASRWSCPDTATFLLTRPSRGATRTITMFDHYCRISTHTPLAGRDLVPMDLSRPDRKFLLTRPSRGATRETFRPSVL